jgi:hypothetical protein
MAKKIISKETEKNTSSSADVYVPDLGSGNENVRSLPVVNTKMDAIKTSPFLLWFHPKRWCVIENTVVPHLQQFPLIPGVCNYTVGRDGKPKVQKHKLDKMEADWIMVEYSWGPNGSYIKQLDARIDGTNETTKIYLPVWANPVAGSTSIKVSSKPYSAWLISLMDKGLLPKPDAYIGEKKLEEVTNIINSMKRDKLQVPDKLLQAQEAWAKLAQTGEEILEQNLFQLPDDEE